jgi:hypothetical protein
VRKCYLGFSAVCALLEQMRPPPLGRIGARVAACAATRLGC